jgi:hypothetical protein
MGSYNWSKGAASNSEDLNIVTLAEVAAVCKSLAGEADALRSASPSRLNDAGDDGLVVNRVQRRQRQM